MISSKCSFSNTVIFTQPHEKMFLQSPPMVGHGNGHLLFLWAGRPQFNGTPGHHPLWRNQPWVCTHGFTRGSDCGKFPMGLCFPQFRGICIYPIIERPDWDDLNITRKSGLWDLEVLKNRIFHYESLSNLCGFIENISSMASK